MFIDLDVEFHILKLLFEGFLPKIIQGAGNCESLILHVKFLCLKYGGIHGINHSYLSTITVDQVIDKVSHPEILSRGERLSYIFEQSLAVKEIKKKYLCVIYWINIHVIYWFMVSPIG